MSNDLTDNLPDDGSRSTNPMLERIVEELRALREESRATREEVLGLRNETHDLRNDVHQLRQESRATQKAIEDLGIHVDRMVAETRSGFRHEISAEVDLINSRLDRLEADVRTLRDGQS